MVDLQTQGAIKEKSVRKRESLQNGNNVLSTTIFSERSGIVRNKKVIPHDNKDQKQRVWLSERVSLAFCMEVRGSQETRKSSFV